MSCASVKANLAETSSKERLSDSELLAQVNSLLFAGSDSVSVSTVWALHYLSLNQDLQQRLREELLPHFPLTPLTTPDIDSATVFPLLDSIVKETLRLTPVVQSSIRVADRDDVIPTEDGAGVKISKGTFIHLPLEGLNVDKNVWGQDAWEFK